MSQCRYLLPTVRPPGTVRPIDLLCTQITYEKHQHPIVQPFRVFTVPDICVFQTSTIYRIYIDIYCNI